MLTEGQKEVNVWGWQVRKSAGCCNPLSQWNHCWAVCCSIFMGHDHTLSHLAFSLFTTSFPRLIQWAIVTGYIDCVTRREPGSSGNIVSDYGLDDRAKDFPSPAEAKDFSSSLCVQTGFGAHPVSCTMGTGGKARPRRDADHSPTFSAEVENEYELYLLSPKAPPWRVAFSFFLSYAYYSRL
jgi:hypothetical protein